MFTIISKILLGGLSSFFTVKGIISTIGGIIGSELAYQVISFFGLKGILADVVPQAVGIVSEKSVTNLYDRISYDSSFKSSNKIYKDIPINVSESGSPKYMGKWSSQNNNFTSANYSLCKGCFNLKTSCTCNDWDGLSSLVSKKNVSSPSLISYCYKCYQPKTSCTCNKVLDYTSSLLCKDCFKISCTCKANILNSSFTNYCYKCSNLKTSCTCNKWDGISSLVDIKNVGSLSFLSNCSKCYRPKSSCICTKLIDTSSLFCDDCNKLKGLCTCKKDTFSVWNRISV